MFITKPRALFVKPKRLETRRRISALNRMAHEDGLSIIEVLAALTILGVVTLGTVPLFMSGMKSTLTTKFETAAKNLSQERFETMRNLPYHVGSSTATPPASCSNDPARINPKNGGGVVECDYKDLLDTYFRSTTAAASSSVGGYVASNAGRSADETSIGIQAPFYRFVINPVPDFQNGRFAQAVVSQFMKADRTIVAPGAAYNTQDSDTDFPVSRLLGVTVITKWESGGQQRKYSVFSQIAEGSQETNSVVMQAQATALRIRTGSGLPSGLEIQLEAGVSRSDGSISNTAAASSFAQGVYASLLGGLKVDGKYGTASTPPASSSTGGTGLASSLSVNGYTGVNFGASDISNVTAGTLAEQPQAPASNPGTNWVTGKLLDAGAATDLGLTNGLAGALNGIPLLHPTLPLVRMNIGASGDVAKGETYVKSTSGPGHYAEAAAKTTLAEIKLLPTVLAPDGLIQIQLVGASALCKSDGTSTTGSTTSFDVRIKYWNVLTGYNSLPALNNLLPPLTNILPDPNTILVSLFPLVNLGSLIQEWAPLSSGVLTPGGLGDSIGALLNSIVHITTQPTRLGDPTSVLNIDVGLVSCYAEDNR